MHMQASNGIVYNLDSETDKENFCYYLDETFVRPIVKAGEYGFDNQITLWTEVSNSLSDIDVEILLTFHHNGHRINKIMLPILEARVAEKILLEDNNEE